MQSLMTMLGLKRSTVTSFSSLLLRSWMEDSERSITGATSGYATWWRKSKLLFFFYPPLTCRKKTIATQREPTSQNSPHTVEIYVPSPAAISPSSEVQSAPGGRLSPTQSSESASRMPCPRSRDPGRLPQRPCKTRKRQAGRQAC